MKVVVIKMYSKNYSTGGYHSVYYPSNREFAQSYAQKLNDAHGQDFEYKVEECEAVDHGKNWRHDRVVSFTDSVGKLIVQKE